MPKNFTTSETTPNATNARLIPWLFVFLWSSGVIFVKWGLHFATPLSFLAVRLILSAMLMALISLWVHPRFPQTVQAWVDTLVTGLLLQVGYQTFFSWLWPIKCLRVF